MMAATLSVGVSWVDTLVLLCMHVHICMWVPLHMDVRGQPKMSLQSLPYFWDRISLASGLGSRLGWPTLENRDMPVILVVLHFQLQATLAFWHWFRALNLGPQACKPITLLTRTVSPPCGICLGFASVAQRAKLFTPFPVLKASNSSSSLGGHNLCETSDGRLEHTSIKILSIRSFLMGV